MRLRIWGPFQDKRGECDHYLDRQRSKGVNLNFTRRSQGSFEYLSLPAAKIFVEYCSQGHLQQRGLQYNSEQHEDTYTS